MLNGINEMVNKNNTNKFNGSTLTWFKDEVFNTEEVEDQG